MIDNFEQVEKLRNEITETLSKISYIAAGAISLSITFLGYLLSIGPLANRVLRASLFYDFQTIHLLFLSWALLFLTISSGFLLRIPNAWYLFNAHAHILYTRIASGADLQSKPEYQIVIDGTKKGKDRYSNIWALMRWGTITTFLLGILALVIFAVIIANGLV